MNKQCTNLWNVIRNQLALQWELKLTTLLHLQRNRKSNDRWKQLREKSKSKHAVSNWKDKIKKLNSICRLQMKLWNWITRKEVKSARKRSASGLGSETPTEWSKWIFDWSCSSFSNPSIFTLYTTLNHLSSPSFFIRSFFIFLEIVIIFRKFPKPMAFPIIPILIRVL